MFKIGEFSKIAQVAVSQLRYYDKIGLFQPEYTDQFTDYRYYRASQLPDLNRILAMKELGLTLEQIHRLVADNVSAEEIRGMLALKKAQAEQELHATLDQLHHIEARLRQVELEGELSMDDVIMRELPAQPIYSFRHIFPDLREAPVHRMEITRLLPDHISQKNLSYFAVLLHEEAFMVENADVEMGFLLNDVVDKPLQLSSGHSLSTRMLPRVEMAACIARVGGFENGYESYGTVGRWLEANDYRLAGPIREVFIEQAPPDRIEEMVCEIQLPVTLEGQRPQLIA
ncbi:MerR family transcriptional regulator [Chloroflexi bacterium TSY]|nr:MerR family transcriptional regulator [Chloroflexi bacterium TSY]